MTYLRIIAALWALTFLLAIVGCFQPLANHRPAFENQGDLPYVSTDTKYQTML